MAVALIAGLGNPGDRYTGTRHNAGFWFADAVVAAHGGQFQYDSRSKGEVARLRIDGHDLRVVKPQAFMNHSGQVVGALARFYRIPVEAILVAHDELDLGPGCVRLKSGGGHGGHNGLRDLISHLGGRDFHRLRLGIGHPGSAKDVVDYVLTRPSVADRRSIDDAIDDTVRELPGIVAGDFANAMNRLHSR